MPQRINRKQPKVGSKYIKNLRGGKSHTLEVIKENGDILYKLGGSKFRTPTAAAKHIVNYEVNGWKYWGIE